MWERDTEYTTEKNDVTDKYQKIIAGRVTAKFFSTESKIRPTGKNS
jgi:hypothetical protein